MAAAVDPPDLRGEVRRPRLRPERAGRPLRLADAGTRLCRWAPTTGCAALRQAHAQEFLPV
jgi:hypothetical protein